jgi:hypothetical protein
MPTLRALLALLLLAVSFGAAAQSSAEFDRLERQLRLKPHQKAQFDMASAATQRALVASAFALLQAKEQLREELGKERPDLATLLRSQEAAFELARPLFREAGDEWTRLYALLDDDQVVIARRYAEERLRSLPGLIR